MLFSSGGEYGSGGPTFLFTGLNELKPAMIAEATARAREGAEQFAKDSGSALGGIRRANQGLFEILPRDRAQGISEQGLGTRAPATRPVSPIVEGHDLAVWKKAVQIEGDIVGVPGIAAETDQERRIRRRPARWQAHTDETLTIG